MVSFSPRSGKLNIWCITLHSELEQRECNLEAKVQNTREVSGWGESEVLRLQMQPATASEPCWLQGAVCWWLGLQAVLGLHPSSLGLLKIKNWDGLVVPSEDVLCQLSHCWLRGHSSSRTWPLHCFPLVMRVFPYSVALIQVIPYQWQNRRLQDCVTAALPACIAFIHLT